MSGAATGECRKKCWTAAAVVGALVFFAFLIGAKGFFTALILGAIAGGLLGLLLVFLACSDGPTASRAGEPVSGSVSGTAAAAGTSAAASPAAAVVSPTPPVEPASEPAPDSEQKALAERARPEAAPSRPDTTTSADETPPEAARAGSASTSAAASPAAAVVASPQKEEPKPDTDPVLERDALTERARPEEVAHGAGVASEDEAPAPEPDSQAPARSDMAKAPDPEAAEEVPLVKPSTPLAGQAELAERKGKYDKGD